MAINGTSSSMFRSTKGLKQGDPMSPFVFILVVEVLSVMINRVASLNLISGFKLSSEAFEINHLQFADDLIIFLDDKCTLPIGNVVNTMEAEIIFGCQISAFPMKYLGIPLGSKSKAVGVWDVILQNFQKKLSMWQMKHLSKGGRIMLIQNVLSSLPVYYLSPFQLPVSVEKQMEKTMRQFLWGFVNNKPKKG
ncbi:uncharacterized protein LOC113305885 [Papaver somniferum]|uniref:uncharacterized protein LOC113305885 n=1 Tax=Papaver somniferum TaxID=3469 RepID=UPI000E6FD853|nr:uncharacterized protein LOC113305885 [Papaver somniferum]